MSKIIDDLKKTIEEAGVDTSTISVALADALAKETALDKQLAGESESHAKTKETLRSAQENASNLYMKLEAQIKNEAGGEPPKASAPSANPIIDFKREFSY